MSTLTLKLTSTAKTFSANKNEVFLITNGDLRESANQTCWAIQEKFEDKLSKVLKERFDYSIKRIHDYNPAKKHGFISSQREGCDVLSRVDPHAPLIILITVWQYSHHLVPALARHKGPVLVLANFDGTWPGLVGALCLEGSLTSINIKYSRLWSQNFDDDFFYNGLDTWLKTGKIIHDTSYLKAVKMGDKITQTPSAQIGKDVGNYILENKEIIGLFDTFCMGMINGIFPQRSLIEIGMPLEGLSQSALVYEMSLVPQALREECLNWYIERGMTFKFGADEATELTRNQVLEQCAMMIAMARFVKRFGLSSVGVQYQQGLKDICAASDFAEGAIGSTMRFPIPDENGEIIAAGKPIPCINEVDMGTAIPQTMLYRLLDSLGLPSETTLHDIRWGSEYKGTFYWDFEISGAVPFEHIKGGIKGAIGNRQPSMFFPKGGSTLSGQGKAGSFIWARAHYEGTDVIMHIGTGEAFELDQAEHQRRLDATCDVWPLMNCILHGVTRDDLMAGHQSNHISIAYVPKENLQDVLEAFVAQALTQNMQVMLAGQA
ncbi:L-fucose isomerase [Gammaproteobacteria bacterium]|nr:L-fucose isomerase [Gammaproteobacteria bacterium]